MEGKKGALKKKHRGMILMIDTRMASLYVSFGWRFILEDTPLYNTESSCERSKSVIFTSFNFLSPFWIISGASTWL